MATTYNSAYFNQQDPARLNTSRNAPSNVASGDVQFAVIPYVLSGSEIATQTISLCILPAGVIPVPQLSSVTSKAAASTALTIDIGTAEAAPNAGDLDGWAKGIVQTNGGVVNCASVIAQPPAWLTTPTPLPADAGSGNAVIIATLATVNGLTPNTQLTFTLAYKRGK